MASSKLPQLTKPTLWSTVVPSQIPFSPTSFMVFLWGYERGMQSQSTAPKACCALFLLLLCSIYRQ